MTLKVPVTPEDHIQGKIDALVMLVEYGDYECPHCKRAHFIIKNLQNHFGDKVGFVFRNFPLAEMHPHAEPAAEAAECATMYERFWEMHDHIFEEKDPLNLSTLIRLGEELQLPDTALEEAVTNKTYQTKIRQDFLGGVKSGVNGTPTFFINGERYNGPSENLMETIHTILLNEQG